MKGIILFDGVCHLCVGSVQFIIKRDPTGKFKFTSLQSEAGKQYLQKYKLENELDTFIFLDVENEKVYTKSTAALRVCKELSSWARILYPLLIVPRPIRDFVYTLIAKNRYKWFGRKESCMIPTPSLKKRFIE